MEGLLLFSIAGVFTGALLAWFHRGTICGVFIKTTLATVILFTVVVLLLDGPPEHFTPRYLLQGLAYTLLPFAIFILAPSFVSAGITLLVCRIFRPKNTHAATKTVSDLPLK